MSSQRTQCLRLVYTGVLSIHPVLYWAFDTFWHFTQTGVEGEGKGTKGMKVRRTDNQGLQICWNMDYGSLKVEGGVNLNFSQDYRNNYCSSSYSQQQTLFLKPSYTSNCSTLTLDGDKRKEKHSVLWTHGSLHPYQQSAYIQFNTCRAKEM